MATAPNLSHTPVSDEILATLREGFAKTAAEHDRDASFPFENFSALHEYGLLALTIAPEKGGLGGGLSETSRVVAEIAKGDPSTALVLIMQYLIHAGVEKDRWPGHLRRHIEAEAVSRGALVNALRVEPELGTPSRGGLPVTTARRDGDGWRISGHKLFSTGSPILSYMLIWGRTEGDDPHVGHFLVPGNSPGIRIEETWNHAGMRASGSHDVILEDVAIPFDHAVDLRRPAEWNGENSVQTAWMVSLLGSLYDAVAQQGRDWFARFARTRVPSNLGAPLSTLYRYQELLGRIDALLLNNRILLQDLVRRTEAGAPPPASETLLLKYIITGNAIDAVALAVEATGNPGLTRNNPLERHYRDVLCSRAHAPQNDSILTLAGRTGFHQD
ncbi:acyl-CoA dehydrogenase family protein [Sphingobium chungbukense]|uniref:Acyl-CoA dehydrogenase n=1 Tax=Sphingobium chungbukense TaxID=56193 RepID=A0A0M3ATR1_9SPHN|nr:acyl-CoA dehydrogenase family protein [Sphingobium chungbukense]KKW91934.1 acyl-CoA dehydrogenase [Sphingobium chungbukense]